MSQNYDEDFGVDDDFADLDAPIGEADAAPPPAEDQTSDEPKTADDAAATTQDAPAPPAAAAAYASTTPPQCELCDDEPASVKCTVCESSGIGSVFCGGCADQLHSSAKGKLHPATDLAGRPLGGEADATPASPTTTALADTPTPPAATATTPVDTASTPVVAAPATPPAPTPAAKPVAVDDDHDDEYAEDDSFSDLPVPSSFEPILSADESTAAVVTAASVADHFHARRLSRTSDPSPFAQLAASTLAVDDDAKNAVDPTLALCDICHHSVVHIHCRECARDFCDSCDEHVHRTKELRGHSRDTVSHSLNARVAASTSTAIESSPVEAPVTEDDSSSATPKPEEAEAVDSPESLEAEDQKPEEEEEKEENESPTQNDEEQQEEDEYADDNDDDAAPESPTQVQTSADNEDRSSPPPPANEVPSRVISPDLDPDAEYDEDGDFNASAPVSVAVAAPPPASSKKEVKVEVKVAAPKPAASKSSPSRAPATSTVKSQKTTPFPEQMKQSSRLRKPKSTRKSRSKSPAAKSVSPTRPAQDAEEEYPDPSVDASNHTVLEQVLSVLLEDPVLGAGAPPVLEGMILPTTVVLRAGRPTAVYFTDQAGRVRHHAWNRHAHRSPPRVPEQANASSVEQSPPLRGRGRDHLSPVRARTSAQAASLLRAFSPHGGGGVFTSPAANASGPALGVVPPPRETLGEQEVLQVFTPQLRAGAAVFLRKQTHRRKARSDADRDADGLAVEEKTASPVDPADEYSADEDQQESSAAAGGASSPVKPSAGVVAPDLSPASYTEAYQQARARRGYIDIEAWKREERRLMQARQRAAHAEVEAARAREKADARARDVATEKMIVALLVYARGATERAASFPLPAPVPLTLGQVRRIFRSAVVAPEELPTTPALSHLARYDALLQKLEFAPGSNQSAFRVEYDERISTTQVRVWQHENTTPAPNDTSGIVSQDGIRSIEAAYTVKGPSESLATHTRSVGPLRADDVARRMRRVVFHLLRRLTDGAKLGPPSFLQCYFQQGVAAPPTHGPETIAAGAATSITMLPGELRRRPWYFLFADQLEFALQPHQQQQQQSRRADADAARSGRRGGNLSGQFSLASDGSSPSPSSSPKSANSSGSVLPALVASPSSSSSSGTSYAPHVSAASVSIDRSTCVKCKRRVAAGEGRVVMLKALLLKWVPNSLYEYPEDLFADVLGVDEDPRRANWHRSTVHACDGCIAEIRALRTIPSRTQLAPWLKAAAASQDVDMPREAGAASALLPYLSRAPVLHSRGPGHAGELIPGVAFIAKKHSSLLELQGVVGPSGGLALHPLVEAEGNRGTHEARAMPAAVRALAHAASVPDLARARDGLSPGLLPRGAGAASSKVTTRGTYRFSYAYMDETPLNPHEHPTHLLGAPVPRTTGLSPVRRGFALARPAGQAITNSPLRDKLPAATRALTHSTSAGLLGAHKSPVAGGAGTAPSAPHQPGALLAPVQHRPTKKKAAWPTTADGETTSAATRAAQLPTIADAAAAASRKRASGGPLIAPLAAKTSTQRITAPVVAAGGDDDDYADDYADDDGFEPTSTLAKSRTGAITSEIVDEADDNYDEDYNDDTEDATAVDDAVPESYVTDEYDAAPAADAYTAADAGATDQAAVQQPWWDEAIQQWSYEPYPTDYTPVIYDPNAYAAYDDTAAQQTANTEYDANAYAAAAPVADAAPDSSATYAYDASAYDVSTVARTVADSAAVAPSPPEQTVARPDKVEEEENYEETFDF